MNLKKWLFLFFTTLAIGAFGTLVTGLILERGIWSTGFANILAGMVGHIGAGLLFSLITQMGFFAYLTINYFGLGIFKSKTLWQAVQVILIAFIFFDLVYFRYGAFGEGGSYIPFIWIPAALLLYAIAVSYFKVKQTNSSAAIPTVFFIFGVTILEWIPALRENNPTSMVYMLVPVLTCNTWQIMQLHRLTAKK